MEEGEKQRDRTLLHHRKRKKVTRSETQGGQGGLKRFLEGKQRFSAHTATQGAPGSSGGEEERKGEKMEGGSQTARSWKTDSLTHTHTACRKHTKKHTLGLKEGGAVTTEGGGGEEKMAPDRHDSLRAKSRNALLVHSPANRLSGACSLSSPREGVSHRATP